MSDEQFIQFQDDFYNLLEKYGVKDIDIEHPKFTKILNLRNKVLDFILQNLLLKEKNDEKEVYG
tara:strand:- start:210 stop:401 length:192 start_codon:yes stop_codon:yes gene_type:complete